MTLQTKFDKNLISKTAEYRFFFESYGVKISFATNSSEAFEAVKKALEIYLPNCLTKIEPTETDFNFLFTCRQRGNHILYKNGEEILNLEKMKDTIDSIASQIRLTVAEFAVGYVFIHAGVVARNGKGVIIPGRSFRGKTTLTVELVRRGAVYYSDEYAILDAEGFLHPFPKMLSVRGKEADNYSQTDYPVEHFGGTAGTEKIRAGMVLLCEYKENARWNPKILSPANGVIETIAHTVPVRQNPRFTLDVLNKVAAEAVFVKAKRKDVMKSAATILKFIDAHFQSI